jgi:uncharacterized membrane protein SirB2
MMVQASDPALHRIQRMSTELAAFYPALRLTHISLVFVSGTLFALRGLAVLQGRAWAMRRTVRLLSYSIDSVLLAAAVLLLVILQLDPLLTPWLFTKIGLLLVYIVLGSLALKRARTWPVRLTCYLAALLCYGFMLSVALTHSPRGALLWLVL